MIKFLDLNKINARHETHFKEQFQLFLDSGHYILGNNVTNFETNFANYCGTKYALGVSNGFDALVLIFKGYIALGKLKIGDEVIVPANTFIATILAIIAAGLKPVLVEPNAKTFNLNVSEVEKHISKATKAIVVVHLYGQLAEMEALNDLAKTNQLLLIEDAAQAHGAKTKEGLKAGNLSDAAAFSFYPSKNLGALGDAGGIVSNNEDLIDAIRKIRNYGSRSKYYYETLGVNCRLDDIQAAFLNLKLKHLDADNNKRRAIATQYLNEIKNNKIKLPYYDLSKNHVFYAFVILVKHRQDFINYMSTNQIETLIHYPIPPHKQDALSHLKVDSLPITEAIHTSIVSIPISPVMPIEDVKEVIRVINQY